MTMKDRVDNKIKELKRDYTWKNYCVGKENLTFEKTSWEALTKHVLACEIKARIEILNSVIRHSSRTILFRKCAYSHINNLNNKIKQLKHQLSELGEV